jgi:hypothetical protein
MTSSTIDQDDTDSKVFAMLKAQAAKIGQHLLKTPGGLHPRLSKFDGFRTISVSCFWI